jgi:hypothetical protein
MGKEFEIGRPIATIPTGNGPGCVIVGAVAYLSPVDRLPDLSQTMAP